ncbi:hypothetical protein PAXRUDRAFT_140707, partial [Paxillus rubicundulus Ve08.2h10]
QVEHLLKDQLFISHLISIVIDEAHCFTEWEDFHPEYQEKVCLGSSRRRRNWI